MPNPFRALVRPPVSACAAALMLSSLLCSSPASAASASPGPRIGAPMEVRVIDGDTFDFKGDRIRIAGIDAPETNPPRCPEEAKLGRKATRRLRELLRAGPFELRRIDRDEDVYGRKLRNVYRGKQSLGDVLVKEGLARPYGRGRKPWCPQGVRERRNAFKRVR